MKTAGLVILAVIAGLLAGLILSEIIAVVGALVFGTAAGIKHLPLYLGGAGAVAVPLLTAQHRSRSR